jgi:Holliday junction resolvasome RuvABC endonuclease subunit
MKILALDISTSTGWAVLNDNKLEGFGRIILKQKNIAERLYEISEEVKKLLEKYEPEFVGIEDTIMGYSSGVKVAILLARLSGCVIKECYDRVGENIVLMNPGEWKKSSLEGLTGKSKKWEIQLAVAKHFGFIDKKMDSRINQVIYGELEKQSHIKGNIHMIRDELDKLKRVSRKKVCVDSTSDIQNEMKGLERSLHSKRKVLKDIERGSEREFNKLGKEIFLVTGISEDMADAIGIAMATRKKIKRGC